MFGRPLSTSVLSRGNSREHKSPFVLPEKPKLWDMWDTNELTWQQVSTGFATGAGYHVRDWAKLMVSGNHTLHPRVSH